MKKISLVFAALLLWCSGILAQDHIITFIENANRYASVDLPDFQKCLRAEYNIRNRVLNECYKRCGNDWGNVGMILEIAKTTGKNPNDICNCYERYKKHGWGRVLKEAGIAPNSNYYKKFYDRMDIQGKSWKKSHDAYCNQHPKYHKGNNSKHYKDKYSKPDKNRSKHSKKHGDQRHHGYDD